MYFQVLVQLLVRSCTFGSLNGGHVIWALYDAVLAQQLRLASRQPAWSAVPALNAMATNGTCKYSCAWFLDVSLPNVGRHACVDMQAVLTFYVRPVRNY